MDNEMFEGNAEASAKTAAEPTSAQERLDAAHQALADAEQAVTRAREKVGEDLSDWLRAAATESLAQSNRDREQREIEVQLAAAEVAASVGKASPVMTEPAAKAGAGEGAPAPDPGQDGPALMFATSEQFLHHQLLPLYIRIIDSRNNTWCQQWFRHPEALSRVDALWRAWEHLRLDGKLGSSVWWKDHADPHMAVLLSQKGPFHECDLERHKDPAPIPCQTAPEGWFVEEGGIPFP
uniref:DUF4913 domain-containing protein n=1 Tax=Arthrobacter sp. TaxID=1667 RepID=UPI0020D232B7|nr:DUF4913 domain-containing protein [Arthrobacter sp.]